MPNHTANIVKITGPKADILCFIEKAKSQILTESDYDDTKKYPALDFNKFVPMPEELRNTSSPVHIHTQEEIDQTWAEWNKLPADHPWRQEGRPFHLGITQEQYDALIAKYGCADWYSWANANWGTKWGAYDISEWDIDEESASISFNTAWSPATPFWIKVSQEYPTLTFVNKFADEGGSFLGYDTIQNGNSVETEMEWDSPDGIELRKELGRWYEDEA